MLTIDLTHTLHESTPAYPGTAPPKIIPANTLATDGFRESLLTIFSHTGTHMDAPAHLLEEGLTLDALDPDRFLGQARVLHLNKMGSITRDMVAEMIPPGAGVDFLLIATGWDRRWGGPDYFEGFPTLTLEAAAYLATTGLKGIGVDAISVDPVESSTLPVHRVLLEAEILIVENLKGLEALPDYCWFCTLPLKFLEADGAPVRAIARYE